MAYDYWTDWAETFAVILLLIGFIFAISLKSALFIYIVIFIAGIFAGRYFYSKIGKQPLFPFFLILIGFLFGYLLGAIFSEANKEIIAFLFFTGWILSHYAHKKGYLKFKK